MKPRILGRILMAGALLAGAGFAENISDLAHSVRHEILMYPHYTIWDDVTFRVDNGTVELSGAVNQPYKKSDIEKIVAGIPGVVAVKDDLKVLPLSSTDDQLRLRVARAIFGDPALSRYAMPAVPSIHIIVDNGHVRLEGVVDNQMDKNIAGIRASGAGLSFGPIQNNLQVESKAKKS